MAWMSQEKKQSLSPAIKAICKRYGVKASLSVRNGSSLTLTITSAPFDIIANHNKLAQACADLRGTTPDLATGGHLQVNHYQINRQFSGKSRRFLNRVIAAMNDGNHDNSDSQIDYFDVGWYINVHVGRWNKPFIVEA